MGRTPLVVRLTCTLAFAVVSVAGQAAAAPGRGDDSPGGTSALVTAPSSAKRVALAMERLSPIVAKHDAGKMTTQDYQAKRIDVLGDLGFLPASRCAARGEAYWCPSSNVLPERVLAKLAAMPRSTRADTPAAALATAVLDHGRRVPFVYALASGEIVRVSYRPGDCDAWSEDSREPIPFDVSRVVDLEPPQSTDAPLRSWSQEVLQNRFDPIIAHSELDAIDPSACWSAGGATGFGKAQVTFGTDGSVLRVDVQGPPASGPPLASCIGRTFGAAMIPPFRGPEVTATATFYVGHYDGTRGVDEEEGLRAARYTAPVDRCDGPARSGGDEARITRIVSCSAHGLAFACAHSNVLPTSIARSVRRQVDDGDRRSALEVGAYGASGLLPARAVRVRLAGGQDVSYVYVTDQGEIVRVFDDRRGLWWTEGDKTPIPFDVGSVQSAGPSPG